MCVKRIEGVYFASALSKVGIPLALFRRRRNRERGQGVRVPGADGCLGISIERPTDVPETPIPDPSPYSSGTRSMGKGDSCKSAF